MRKFLFIALSVLSLQSLHAQTVTQGEGNKEPFLLSLSAGSKQWFTDLAQKSPVNSYFIGIGRMPTLERPFYFDAMFHYIPKYNFDYEYTLGRRFSGVSKNSQAAYLGFGIMIAKKYSRSKVHGLVGFGVTGNFNTGYESISPEYRDWDYMIDNNGFAIGVQPHIGVIYRITDKIYLEGKLGYSLQGNKNQYPRKAELFNDHFWSQIGLKFNASK